MHTHPLIQGKRVVRPRKRGAPLPEGGVYVGRPTIWGNPFQDRVGGHARSVILHAKWLDGRVGARCSTPAGDLSCAMIAAGQAVARYSPIRCAPR